jgi:hypothetical protein
MLQRQFNQHQQHPQHHHQENGEEPKETEVHWRLIMASFILDAIKIIHLLLIVPGLIEKGPVG